MISLDTQDSGVIYARVFEEPDGFSQFLAVLRERQAWDSVISRRVYELYASYVVHVLTTRRERAALAPLSEHLLQAKDALHAKSPDLALRLEVFEDLIDEALVDIADLPKTKSVLAKQHVVEILAAIADRSASGVDVFRSHIREKFSLGEANTTRLTKMLEQAGLVSRKQVGRDASFELTSEGLALVEKLKADRDVRRKGTVRVRTHTIVPAPGAEEATHESASKIYRQASPYFAAAA